MPIYLMVDANNTAKVVYQSCIRSADLAFEPGGFGGDNRDELKAVELRCSRSFYNMRMSPEELSNNFFPMPIHYTGSSGLHRTQC
jgi:hypothetical protein